MHCPHTNTTMAQAPCSSSICGIFRLEEAQEVGCLICRCWMQVTLPGHICAVVVTTLVLEGWSSQLDPSHSVLTEVRPLSTFFSMIPTFMHMASKGVSASLLPSGTVSWKKSRKLLVHSSSFGLCIQIQICGGVRKPFRLGQTVHGFLCQQKGCMAPSASC